jgi:hypothetical protein
MEYMKGRNAVSEYAVVIDHKSPIISGKRAGCDSMLNVIETRKGECYNKGAKE